MRRIHLSALVLVTWLAMIGWQFRREYFQPELTRLAEAALSLAPGVNFYTLRLGDRTVGQATSRLDTVPEGFELEDVMVLDLPALGQTGSAVVRSTVSLSPALVMESFLFSLRFRGRTFPGRRCLGRRLHAQRYDGCRGGEAGTVVSAGGTSDFSLRPCPSVLRWRGS